MLEARDIVARYGQRTVLNGVTLCLPPGEVLAVAGPNGAGKSTLLAVMTRVLTPDRGTVLLNGEEMTNMSPGDLAVRRAVLEQTPVRDLPFTVAELVEMAIPTGIAPPRVRAIVADVVARLDLVHLAHQPVTRLSGGEAHRAHLARTLAQLRAGRDLGHGHYLLVDEPTASLDLAHQRDVLTAARAVADEGAGVLIVLHDLTLAAAVSDRIVLMNQGRIAAEGTPADVLVPEILEAVYRTPLTTVRIDGQLAVLPRLEAMATPRNRTENEGDTACLSQ